MQEKYGFVYLWYDRKYKRYYVGSHWGTEDDGYICSSSWLHNSKRNRPEDFKRRILKRIFTNREDTYTEEKGYLDLIKDEELGVRYYNYSKEIKVGHGDPWNKGKQSSEETKKKLSTYNKENGIKPPSRKGCISQTRGITKKERPSLARPNNGGHNIPIPRTGCKWYNNGEKETLSKFCSEGYKKGRLNDTFRRNI